MHNENNPRSIVHGKRSRDYGCFKAMPINCIALWKYSFYTNAIELQKLIKNAATYFNRRGQT